MTRAAPRLVALAPTDLDGGALRGSGRSVDEPLVPRGQVAADDADGVQFVDALRHGQELRTRPERFAAKVHVGSDGDDADAPVGEVVDQSHGAVVQEPRFVDGYDLRIALKSLRNLNGVADGDRLDLGALVGADPVGPSVPIIQMRLEDLHLRLGDESPTDPTDHLLGLAAEHDPRDHFDPPFMGAVVHFSLSAARGQEYQADRRGNERHHASPELDLVADTGAGARRNMIPVARQDTEIEVLVGDLLRPEIQDV